MTSSFLSGGAYGARGRRCGTDLLRQFNKLTASKLGAILPTRHFQSPNQTSTPRPISFENSTRKLTSQICQH